MLGIRIGGFTGEMPKNWESNCSRPSMKPPRLVIDLPTMPGSES